MAQPPPIRKRRPVWIISAAVTAVVYVVIVGLVVLRQPDAGRSSTAELAAGMQTALVQRDADAFESLFARGALPDGYADDLLAQLPAGAQVETRPITVGEREAVSASVISGPSAGAAAGWWCRTASCSCSA